MQNPFRLLALCWLLFTGLPKTFGQDISLADSVDYYYGKGKFTIALPFARQWVEKARIAHGDQSVEFAAALNSLGDGLSLEEEIKAQSREPK